MHYVKDFDINGVVTRQVGCIELRGKPNAATEGSVGVLGIDIYSPTHDVYKCVAVKGGTYTWELLSSGMSIITALVTGGGSSTFPFNYTQLRTPAMYVLKKGDLILDSEWYLYQVTEIGSTGCLADYTGSQITSYGMSAYELAVKNGFEGSEKEWLASLKGAQGESGVMAVTSGFFSLTVDSDGNLYANTADGDVAPTFEYDESSGNLYGSMED